jgi:Protein of unknown function (DUF3617)
MENTMRHTTLLIILILGAGLAQAQDVPKRKSGLWEVTRTTTRTENRPIIVQWCVDEQTDNALAQIAEGLRNESCTVDKMSRDGDKLTVDAVCKVGREQVASKTHAVITGKFDSAYKVESKSSYDPPMRGNAEGTALLQARWLGPCKPGQHPGDMMIPGLTDDSTKPKTGAPSNRLPGSANTQKSPAGSTPTRQGMPPTQ